MRLLDGINHVAVLTDDLGRFIDFYRSVFEVDVVFEEAAPEFRHAILRTGSASWLHPVEVRGNPHGAALAKMFDRGHLDHLSLTAGSQTAFQTIQQRLVERGASDGAVEDLGAFHSLWFEDPDGMRVEVTVIVDAALGGIHDPRPLVAARP